MLKRTVRSSASELALLDFNVSQGTYTAAYPIVLNVFSTVLRAT